EKALFIFDEPTTGLHFQDVRMLVNVIQQLVDKGNTVMVIEHNLDLIKAADWVIDMGPEGGRGGGEIIATGTPEEVAEVQKSETGKFLKQEFDRLEKQLA
ncbi:MAG TPA: excinuclease ABC subunit A, partial [Balneolaceae bacterium]|nr:excinuclease ABC subunit A [Balneolaceae bacterium]